MVHFSCPPLAPLSFIRSELKYPQLYPNISSSYLLVESTWFLERCHFVWMLQQTIWLFFRDMVMGLGLMVVVGPPVVAAIIFIVQKGGPYLALYLWAFMLLLSLVLMAVYPVLIAPLFNKFTPVSLASFWVSIWVVSGFMKSYFMENSQQSYLWSVFFFEDSHSVVWLCRDLLDNNIHLRTVCLFEHDSKWSVPVVWVVARRRPASENWEVGVIPQLPTEEAVCDWWLHSV